MAFSPRTPADEAWRPQLHAAHVAARLASRPLVVAFYDGRSGAEVDATVLAADTAHDDFVLRLPDGVRPPRVVWPPEIAAAQPSGRAAPPARASLSHRTL